MQTAASETEIKSRYLSICVHHYTLRAPCPKGQGMLAMTRKANRVKWLRRTVMPQGSQAACPPSSPHRPEFRAATARGNFRGSTRPR